MRILISIFFVSIYLHTFSQNTQGNKLSLSVNTGSTIPWSRIAYQNKYSPISSIALDSRYMFNHEKGLRFNAGYNVFSFKGGFPSTHGVFFTVGPAFNLLSLEKQKRFGLVASAALGYFANWNRDIYDQASFVVRPKKGSVDEGIQGMIGISPQFKLTNRINIHLEVQVLTNFLQQQGFDFYDNDNSPYNNRYWSSYGNVSAGLTVYLGKCKEHVDWSNQCIAMPITPSPVQKDTVPQVVSVTPDPKTTENSTEELTTTNTNTVKENVEPVEVEAADQDGYSDSAVKTDEVENATNESIINDLLFALGSAWLHPKYANQLNSLASDLIEHPEKKLTITGHSDLSGTDAINNELSKQRAAVVYQYLIKKGVNKTQITTEYKGSKGLKYIGRSDEIDAANRRVSFSFH